MSKKKGIDIPIIGVASWIFAIVVSYILPFYGISSLGIQFSKKIETEGLNGILTISAIIFGFSSFLAYERTKLSTNQRITLYLIFFVQIFSFLVVGLDYFFALVRFEAPTVGTLTLAFASLLLNILSWATVRLFRAFWGIE